MKQKERDCVHVYFLSGCGAGGKNKSVIIMCLCTEACVRASLRACLLYVSTPLGLFHLPGKPE